MFYDDLTVWEHLEYVAKLHGTDGWEQHAADLLELLGLTDRGDDLPTTFSRGLRQKAAIAIAFVRPFELLLVDEPFVGLDQPGREALLELFDRAHARRRDARRRHPRAGRRQRGRAGRRPARRRGDLRRPGRRRRRRRPRRPLRRARVDASSVLVTIAAMYDFDSVSVSSFEAASLAAKLTEKSADGWDVVAIVPAGSDVIAYLRRSGEPTATSASDDAARRSPTARATRSSSAASTTDSAADLLTPTSASSEPAVDDRRHHVADAVDRHRRPTPAAPAGEPAPTPRRPQPPAAGPAARSRRRVLVVGRIGAAGRAPPATPSVPAGWYADPAGRFELRYWDGSAWTEHVSRAGQQYTDPPVA